MNSRPKLQQKLSQRQSQSLVMTQQLQQAIRLLQMSNLELQAFIAEELERNPLLELGEEGEDGTVASAGGEETANGEAAPDEPASAQIAAPEAEGADLAEAFAAPAPAEQRMQQMDMDPREVFEAEGAGDGGAAAPAAGGWRSSGGARGFDDEAPDLEATLRSRKSLREHLLEQAALLPLSAPQRLIAEQLIARIDADGYLREPLHEIAAQLGAQREEVEEVLQQLQTLEPAGVFARDLAECFRLQLAESGELTPAMDILLDNLELLARREFDRLAALSGVDVAELPAMMERLRRLDARPGADFGAEEAGTVVADVIVRAAPDGSWIVELNGDTLPKVLINNHYRAIVEGGAAAESDRLFIHDCLSRANWLVKSLDQRARTILAVAREIVRRQDGFFARGVHALKPLTLKQVAEALNMHESTISRVVANKYMDTPRGILPLRYFFTTALNAADGEEGVSAEAVRHRIRELIEGESPDAVLSDDAIVAILRREGIDIARRTVAKYREAMGIPSSVRRRREKKLLARAAGN